VSTGEYTISPSIALQVSPGQTCTFNLSSSSVVVGSSGGNSSVQVTTAAGCAWTASSNAPWLSIASGTSGTGNGQVTFSAQANGGSARTGTLTIAGRTFTVTQNSGNTSGALDITPQSLANALVNTPYSVTFNATGGTGPYTWALTGALPPGLSFSPTGVLSGTPSTTGSYSFVVTVTGQGGQVFSRSYLLGVIASSGQGPVITTTNFPNAVVGTPYSNRVEVAGGCGYFFAPPPTVRVESGTLPVGLLLSQVAGVGWAITGQPTTPGRSTFTLAAVDNCGNVSTRTFSIEVTGQGSTTQSLTVSAPRIDLAIVQGTPASGTGGVNVSTSLNQSVPFTAVAESQGNWLAITSTSSTTTPASITVQAVNAQGLPAGVYEGRVTLTSSQATSASFEVRLTVQSAPTLVATPSQLSFRVRSGDVANSPLTFTSNQTGVNFAASVTEGGSWLSVAPATFQTPRTLQVTVDARSLGAGTYEGRIAVGSLVVPVSVVVTPRPTLSATPQQIEFRAGLGSNLQLSADVNLATTGDAQGFTATVQGAQWLRATPERGSVPGSIRLTADTTGLAAGTYSGTLSILSTDASVAPLQIPVRLTMEAAAVRVIAVTNAASFATGAIAPGEYVTLFGVGFGPAGFASGAISDGRLGTEISRTRVLFDGTAAPLVYISPAQITAIVPYNVTGKARVQMVVETANGASEPVSLEVAETAPGLFTRDGSLLAALNQNGSVNEESNGAEPGSVVSLFGTGEGQTVPAGTDGLIAIASNLATPFASVRVEVDGQQAEVLYAGSAPGAPAGAFQLNVRVPEGTRRGARVPVTVRIGERTSPAANLQIRP
jgi:uncharacterized protein (TIGR03437 family)